MFDLLGWFWAGLDWFQSQPKELQPALLSSFTTLSVFVLGFLTIVGTAFANRRNTLKAARDDQKLEIYKEALVKIDAAVDAQSEADSYLRNAITSLRIQNDSVKEGIYPNAPRQRFPEFSALHYAQRKKVIDLHLFLEQWAVIDPRLEAFRKAFGYQGRVLMDAESVLNPLLILALPTDNPTGGTFPYSVPPSSLLDQLVSAADRYHYETGLLSAYVGDLNVELQQLLLGHLFGHRIVRRDAPDPGQFAIRLDRHRQIVRHFESTPFFRNGAEMEKALRQQHGTSRRFSWKWPWSL